jgi:hypothetical protein
MAGQREAERSDAEPGALGAPLLDSRAKHARPAIHQRD